jgi:hypothetical protein
MDQRVSISVMVFLIVLVLAFAGLAFWQLFAGLAFWQLWGTHGLNVAQGDPTVQPKDFTEGIGIYYFNDGKYNFLIWKKKLLTSEAAPPEEKDMLAAAEQAIRVKKGVRFYTYGLDFSKLGLIPPYAMALCIARDVKTIEGIFPVRIKPVEGLGQIYEIVLPPLIDDLSAGKIQYLFWAINYQYSCNDAWVFKFQ